MSAFSVLLLIFTNLCLLEECRATVLLVGNASDISPLNPECRKREEEITSLVQAFTGMKNNSTIIICSKKIILNQIIRLTDLKNISILGGGAEIKCINDNSSGFQVINVNHFYISSFTILDCSHQIRVSNGKHQLRASFSILISCCIEMSEIVIREGADSGLAMINVEGYVKIEDSRFENNGFKNRSGGNGFYVELSSYLNLSKFLDIEPQNCSSILYLIRNCVFANNIAHTELDDKIIDFSRFDKGGGLCAFVRGKNNIMFTIQNSSFYNNTSYTYGGGIFLSYHGAASANSFIIENTNLTENRAKHGGGIHNGYTHVRVPTFAAPYNCSFIYKDIVFEFNSGNFGGGYSLYSTKTREEDMHAMVNFTNCKWNNNMGHFGSALAILPNAWNVYTFGYLPELTFSNAVLVDNKVKLKSLDHGEHSVIKQYSEGAGAFYCSSHKIQFYGCARFYNNSRSSFYLQTGIVHFHKNSISIFSHNQGYRGGAILLLGSIMYVHEKSSLVFDSNVAYEHGGAIYSSPIASHMHYYSQTCFMEYSQDEIYRPIADRNITMTFRNNTIQHEGSGLGHSIYVSSLQPCFRRHKSHINKLSQFNEIIGTFIFDPIDRDMEISTALNSSKILYNKDHPKNIFMLAGKEETILYEDRDDLGQETATTYLVSVLNDGATSQVSLNEAYRYITTNKLVLYGRGGDSAKVVLSSSGVRRSDKWFNVQIKTCPPGFVEFQDKTSPIIIRCKCSAETTLKYLGITKCDNKEFKAILQADYWAGYDNNNNKKEDENSLLTGRCPFGFCANVNDSVLTSSANQTILNDLVCVNSRTGTLCGQCKAGSKPHFHSPQLECKSSKYCFLGWLFYLLSEILPVTILFVVILVFNVPFTSGLLNGFIFYSQVVEMLPTNTFYHNQLDILSEVLNRLHYLIYMTFNLKPLEMKELSYCIYSSQNSLDIIALNYVTLVYSFVLLLCLLVIISKDKFCCPKVFKWCIPFFKFEQGTVHGLTAFLILCYANCARTSFLLLLSENVYTKEQRLVRSVVYYNGGLEWMVGKHLGYAVPGIVVLFLVCGIPPLLLLIYPAHFRLLSALKVDQWSLTRVIVKPFDKLKPIFDSFQGCFKDHCRFFAGLYFIYRLLIVGIVLLFNIQNASFLLELLFILMILLHAIFQPYRNSRHNTIDMLIFLNLSFIHTLTLYNFININLDSPSMTTAIVTGLIRHMFILLPAIIMMIYVMKKKCSCQRLRELLHHTTSAAQDEVEIFDCETTEYRGDLL